MVLICSILSNSNVLEINRTIIDGRVNLCCHQLITGLLELKSRNITYVILLFPKVISNQQKRCYNVDITLNIGFISAMKLCVVYVAYMMVLVGSVLAGPAPDISSIKITDCNCHRCLFTQIGYNLHGTVSATFGGSKVYTWSI
jgi:hypothetical protein